AATTTVTTAASDPGLTPGGAGSFAAPPRRTTSERDDMLSTSLRLADLQEPRWRSEGGRWTSGESWIESANVSALVMEVNDNQAPRVRVRVKECKRDEADFVELTMEPGQARLAAGT